MKSRPLASMSLWKTSLIALCILVFGVGSGWYLRSTAGSGELHIAVDGKSDAVRDLGESRFTSPLLECAELPETMSIGVRKDLEEDVFDMVEQAKKKGTISNASIYFRDLNNGPWFGVNEKEKFYPASLLKVPLAMYYYQKADTDPGILTQEIEFAGPKGISVVHFPPRETIVEGTIYTIEDLIKLMLQQSDNDATLILSQYAGPEPTEGVYEDFGVEAAHGEGYSIDSHTYASFFRILYNATYLGRSRSEHMLEIMSSSSFTRGITAGVPAGVTVSQKFGEKTLDAVNGVHQLHNCGIVYAPGNPYILCLMTQGRDFDNLASFMKDISALVYNEVTRHD